MSLRYDASMTGQSCGLKYDIEDAPHNSTVQGAFATVLELSLRA
jgi:hypothetical protein